MDALQQIYKLSNKLEQQGKDSPPTKQTAVELYNEVMKLDTTALKAMDDSYRARISKQMNQYADSLSQNEAPGKQLTKGMTRQLNPSELLIEKLEATRQAKPMPIDVTDILRIVKKIRPDPTPAAQPRDIPQPFANTQLDPISMIRESRNLIKSAITGERPGEKDLQQKQLAEKRATQNQGLMEADRISQTLSEADKLPNRIRDQLVDELENIDKERGNDLPTLSKPLKAIIADIEKSDGRSEPERKLEKILRRKDKSNVAKDLLDAVTGIKSNAELVEISADTRYQVKTFLRDSTKGATKYADEYQDILDKYEVQASRLEGELYDRPKYKHDEMKLHEDTLEQLKKQNEADPLRQKPVSPAMGAPKATPSGGGGASVVPASEPEQVNPLEILKQKYERMTATAEPLSGYEQGGSGLNAVKQRSNSKGEGIA